MSDVTKDYQMLQNLSDAQRKAIGLLVEGQRDGQAAQEVGVHRVTVTRWRLYNPAFQAALNLRRRQICEESKSRIRTGARCERANSATGRSEKCWRGFGR
jgi:hypothetical protein